LKSLYSKSGGYSLLVFAALCFFLVSASTVAQDFHFRNYGISDGLTSMNTESVVQDSIGFIWISTQSGLSRFDGVDFANYFSTVGDSSSLMNKSVHNMFVDQQGNLWVSMLQGGIARFLPESDSFRNYAFSKGKNGAIGSVLFFYQDHNNDLIVRTEDKTCFRYDAETDSFEEYFPWENWSGVRGGMAYPVFVDAESRVFLQTQVGKLYETTIAIYDPVRDQAEVQFSIQGDATTIVEDNQGVIWIATWGFGLYRYDPTKKTINQYLPTKEPHSFNGRVVEDLELDDENNLWIGTNMGLFRLNASELAKHSPDVRFDHPLNASSANPIKAHIKEIYSDRSGRLWVATRSNGFFLKESRSPAYSFVRETRSDRENNFLSIYHYEDQSGVQWYARDSLLIRYDTRDLSSQRIVLEHNKMPDGGLLPVLSIDLAPDHRLLISYLSERAVLLDPQTYRQDLVTDSDPIPTNVSDTHRDSAGALWVSTMDGLFRYAPSQTSGYDTIVSGFHGKELLEDKAGFLWVASANQGLVRVDLKTREVKHFRPDNQGGSGLLGGDAKTIALSKKGLLGVMTSKGVHIFNADSGKFEFIDPSANNQLQLTDYFGVDHDGNYWFSSLKGLYYSNAATKKLMFLDKDAGFPETAYYDIKTSMKGEVYVQTADGCIRIDPSLIPAPPIPPKVLFTTLVSENAEREQKLSLLASPQIILSHQEDFIEIDFAPLSYDLMGNLYYEYMLSGSSSGVWVDIDESTKVSFLDLPHGNYTLKVRGRNDFGEFGPVAELAFTVQPPWYYSTVALAAYVLLLIGSVFGYTRWRTYRLLERQKNLELIVEQSTEEIRLEKDRSETLLLNILPQQVADELKEKGEAEARYIDEVTVLFTDFRGFTSMSEILTPKDLVKDLNECFSEFDRICERYGIEKIKTIGDAYMAASGLPLPNSEHAVDVIQAAFEMREFVEIGKQNKIRLGLPYFEIRIGIHTGPVVAGIVGVKKFQYDIWGDTVNTASRMESSGEVGKINISSATYAVVKENENFSFTPRGEVIAKGKGKLEMYYVERMD
jgi:class 3 adenylate cyclase/streptogramin lyase